MKNAGLLQDEGFSLVAVLGFLLLVSSVLVPLSLVSHNRLLTAKHHLDTQQAEMMAQAFVSDVAAQLSSSNITNTPNLKFNFGCEYEDVKFKIKIQSFSGLIDLNTASLELLTLGFSALEFSKTTAFELAKSVVNFRSRSRAPSFSSTIKPDGGNKNSRYESVVELHDFEVLRKFPKFKLEEFFTIHKNSAQISIEQAHQDLQLQINALEASEEVPTFFDISPINADGFYVSISLQLGNNPWYMERVHFKRQNSSDGTLLTIVDSTKSDLIPPDEPLIFESNALCGQLESVALLTSGGAR